MKWRTDKPTADVIVALVRFDEENMIGYKITEYHFRALERFADDFYVDYHTNAERISNERIIKWADLEEDEGTICPQKQRGRPNKVYEYPVEVPNNDGCLEFIYMTNSTIRKKLRLKKGERAIISIRKEI